jgi:predicted thioesterase
MERPVLPEGTTATASRVVQDSDLATTLADDPGDRFPAVFATTRMIALMEMAGGRALLPLLRPGEVSVGVGVDVRHTAPTPSGVRVEAEARFLGMDGKLYLFEVVARDPAGEVGRGLHRRAIVAEERILASAAARR